MVQCLAYVVRMTLNLFAVSLEAGFLQQAWNQEVIVGGNTHDWNRFSRRPVCMHGVFSSDSDPFVEHVAEWCGVRKQMDPRHI